MRIHEVQKNNLTILHIEEKFFDLSNANTFKEKSYKLIDQGFKNLLVNLNNVEFMDSTALGALVSCLKKCGSNGQILLCEPNQAVQNLLKLTRLDIVFKVFSTEEEALDSRNSK